MSTHPLLGFCAACTLCLVGGSGVLGQTPTLRVHDSRALEACVDRGKRTAPDTLLALCRERLVNDGYLELSVDSTRARGDTLHVYAHEGPRYEIGAWTTAANPSTEQGLVRLDTLSVPGEIAELDAGAEPYFEELGRAGYPFATLRYQRLRVDTAASLSGVTTTWSGPRVTYGGVRFPDGLDPPVTTTFLERYLRLEPGRPYRETEVLQLEQRLRNLPWLTVKRPPSIVFKDGLAFLYVDAEPRQSSRFDFLLGFLPNSANNAGQLLLTGDLTLELENALRRGERLFFNFERLQPEVTEVEVEAAYPYLFESRFGAQASFNLYRQRSEWLRVAYEAGLGYSLGGGSNYELYYEGGQAQVLGFDTARVVATQRLPEVLDATRNGFGLRLRLDYRDDAFDTRRGWRLLVDGSAALREVEVPTVIRETSETLNRQADSLGGKTGQFRSSLDVERYFATGRRTTAVLRLRAATLFGAQTPLRNELYRIGGNRLLRGFDEQTLDAQSYAVTTAEYRLLIGNGGYLFAFVDQGLLQDPYRAANSRNEATGFGAGLRLATRAGALSLTYAYGRQQDIPIDWQRAKIHIGYTSRF